MEVNISAKRSPQQESGDQSPSAKRHCTDAKVREDSPIRLETTTIEKAEVDSVPLDLRTASSSEASDERRLDELVAHVSDETTCYGMVSQQYRAYLLSEYPLATIGHGCRNPH